MTWPGTGDTIAAISTPLGEGGIGIVRLSGPDAEAIARRLFRPYRPRPRWQSHRLYLGHFLNAQGQVIDEVLLTLMRAPHSYTREDVVEIHCHSGYAVLHTILKEVLAQGARLAKPGEFTLRAFLLGRLDLSQAEAVLEIIQARTQAALRVAAAHLQGGLKERLGPVRDGLLSLLARLEAVLDFPEEAEEISPAAQREVLAKAQGRLAELLASYQKGRLLREGVSVVLAGRPNVGKSSLLNRLVDADRAIVTDIPGTTRDIIEECLNLNGVPVKISDTAGLREARDPVEELGVARSEARLAQADVIVYLLDGSAPLDPEDLERLRGWPDRAVLVAVNKIDLPLRLDLKELSRAVPCRRVLISALTGEGLGELKQALTEMILGGEVSFEGALITQARHFELLVRAQEALQRGRDLLALGEPPWELLALEVREALTALGEITGEEVGEEVLDQIFSQFCIGK